MSVLPDWRLRQDCRIVPLSEGVKRDGVISYGVSSYGYDARIGYKFKVFSNVWCGVVDPKAFDPRAFVEVDVTPSKTHEFDTMPVTSSSVCVHCNHSIRSIEESYDEDECEFRDAGSPHILIPPNSFVLGETLEEFTIPRDCIALVVGKSTLARCGLIVNVTPGEPEWTGRWTVEISNTTPLPAKVYAGEGIMQVLFLRGESPCEVSYADKRGKYMDQLGLTLPKVD